MEQSTIRLKLILMEDFIQYKKPSMFIGTAFCNFKCCREAGLDDTVCQNQPIMAEETKIVQINTLYNCYVNNDITKAIVFGGLEPFMQFDEILAFIDYFRGKGVMDDIVIYTGYYPEEISEHIEKLSNYENIIVKFGRYIPNKDNRFDEILGVTLVSDNQYAMKLVRKDI